MSLTSVNSYQLAGKGTARATFLTSSDLTSVCNVASRGHSLSHPTPAFLKTGHTDENAILTAGAFGKTFDDIGELPTPVNKSESLLLAKNKNINKKL